MVVTTTESDVAVVKLRGELDSAMVPTVRTRLEGVAGDVELDCADLVFIDSAGISLFVEIHHACVARGAKLTVVNAPRCVTRLLALTGVDRLFPVQSEDGSREHERRFGVGPSADLLDRRGGVDAGRRNGDRSKMGGRYGIVVPARSKGDQRVYSRDELEQLRFVVDLVGTGTTPAEAHRMLAERSRGEDAPFSGDDDSVRIMVLLAERDRYAAELLEYFLRTEGYDVCVAFESERAERLFAENRPRPVDPRADDVGRGPRTVCASGGRWLSPCWRCPRSTCPIEAMAAGASAFLTKPVVPLQFVSTVRDLLGSERVDPTVKIPVVLMQRLSTGNARLDEMLGGGLMSDAITLVVGAPGTGKTILAEQCLFANATPERPGLYLSTVSEPFDKLLRFGQSLVVLRHRPNRPLGVLRRPRRRRPSSRADRRLRTHRCADQAASPRHHRDRQFQGIAHVRLQRCRLPPLPPRPRRTTHRDRRLVVVGRRIRARRGDRLTGVRRCRRGHRCRNQTNAGALRFATSASASCAAAPSCPGTTSTASLPTGSSCFLALPISATPQSTRRPVSACRRASPRSTTPSRRATGPDRPP